MLLRTIRKQFHARITHYMETLPGKYITIYVQSKLISYQTNIMLWKSVPAIQTSSVWCISRFVLANIALQLLLYIFDFSNGLCARAAQSFAFIYDYTYMCTYICIKHREWWNWYNSTNLNTHIIDIHSYAQWHRVAEQRNALTMHIHPPVTADYLQFMHHILVLWHQHKKTSAHTLVR